MKITSIYLGIIAVVFITNGCRQDQAKESNRTDSVITQNDSAGEMINYNPQTMAVLYQQLSAEKYALEYQAYQLARYALAKDLEDKSVNQPRAIILDIDETVLDNSPHQAKLVLQDANYPKYWEEWIKSTSAQTIAGAKEFLQYVKDQGLNIFYITNRKEKFRKATLMNLRKHDLPYADDKHLLMRTNSSSKKKRREKIRKNYHISLLVGDNLNDLSAVFKDKSNKQRKNLVDKQKSLIGKKYIILPNSTYGDWEAAIYDYNSPEDERHKQKKRMKKLKPF